VLLFHGTKPDVVDGVVNQGLDSRLGGKGLFGSGIYLAESSTKADQYAGNCCIVYLFSNVLDFE
jgi:hypothetical protein